MTITTGSTRTGRAGLRRLLVVVGGASRARGWGAFRSLAGNKALVRVVGGYVLFTVTQYSVWVAMLVYAYRHGGAAVAGLVAVAQLVPAAVLAPVAVAVADRRSPVFLLAGGYLVQAAGMAATAVAVIAGVPLAAYGAAVVASAAVATTRPAQSTLIPSVSVTPDQLTAANVAVSWVEGVGIVAAGLLTGALISVAGLASVFAVCAGLGLAAALLVARLRVPPLASSPGRAPAVLADLGTSIALTARQPRLRLMLALLTAEAAVVGALDLLFVILAVSVLHRTQAWAGYLNSAYGLGAVLAAAVSAMLVGRRLGLPILAAALLLSGALAVLAFGLGLAATVALLIVVGASRALLDVASRTLMQRSVPAQLLGRVFGVLEGLTMAGLAVGALLVPGLVYLGGSRLALLGVAAVLPLAAAVGGRGLFGLDSGTPVPVVEIALLRSLPLFADLPAPALEGLAGALTPAVVPGRHGADPSGRPGRRLLCDRRRRARRHPGRALPAPVRTRRGSRRDRPAARHPAHSHRGRAHRRHRLRAGQGALPGRGRRSCSHPAPGRPHRRHPARRRRRVGRRWHSGMRKPVRKYLSNGEPAGRPQ